ncbi:phosphate:Na+ symporter [Alkalibaculum bacchi]|uniref:Phosphate:Na+ symporter n=1 Tax=Alkalibaculum bacchi TaxID=645887 RepID=A0A366I8W8_9FIRM|nr:Na/Pi cotransporter family protein [Alkalibaculum bacchi]RBP65975.1 phosphate:Na+ symporter [Alkalibaculum bacchi]
MIEFIFGLIGGTALLMYGVDMMGDGLERASGKLMKKILSVLTGNIWSAFFVGIATTVLVQSSTAITVLTVGFVNSGLMNLSQAIGIIYGANIGTTVTAQLMAFSFKFKLTEIALPVLGLGFAISYFAKKDVIKNIGSAIMGFGIMFLGLKILNSGVPFIQESESIRLFFQDYASITIIGIILGAVATALVHSSSATVGLVLMLGQAGVITLPGAIAIMLGDNIGTCITAQLASATGNINARRTAWAHTLYNIIGVAICAILIGPFINLIEFFTQIMYGSSEIGLQIANSHTVFNVVSALVFLPFHKVYVTFLEKIIVDKNEDTFEHLDKNLLTSPVAAFQATLQETLRALDIVKHMIDKSLTALYENSMKCLDEINKDEDILNKIQIDITSFVVDISKQGLTNQYSAMIPAFINSINNIERVGDRTIEYLKNISTKVDKQLPFSELSQKEIDVYKNILTTMISITIDSIENRDYSKVDEMKRLEDQADSFYNALLDNHIKRLENDICNVESGAIFVDLIGHMERMADHLYKVYMTLVDENLLSHL